MAGSDGGPLGVPQGGTVGEVGEFPLIERLTALFPAGPQVLLGPGDDAAVVRLDDDRVVATTDLLVAGTHFRQDWSSAQDVGVKAAAQNLADLEAVGAASLALLVGLAAPADLPVEWAHGLAEGLAAEAGRAGASVVGGDVVGGPTLTVAVTALGSLQGRQPVTRAGARPGDVVAVCGRLGWAAAGLAVLRRGFRSPRALVEAHRRPEVPYGQGRAAAEHGATAMVDVSDGLLADLGHVAQASAVGITVTGDAVVLPDPVRDAAAALGADPWVWLLAGGEDHALAATFTPLAGVPRGWTAIGLVTDGPVGEVSVTGVPTASVTALLGSPGYRHFTGGAD